MLVMFIKRAKPFVAVNLEKLQKCVLLISAFALCLFILKPFRSKSVLMGIAAREFQDIPMADSLRSQLSGPVVVDKGIYISCKWFKVLEWGETAMLYIDVFKRPQSFSWRDRFFWPRITMNYKWNYFVLQQDTSKLQGLLPYKTGHITVEALQLDDMQFDRLYQSQKVDFMVSPKILLLMLKKGFFSVIEKKQSYAMVAFYEPIAQVRKNGLSPKTWVSSAQLSINDSLQVFINPMFHGE